MTNIIPKRDAKSHKGTTISQDLCFAEILSHLPAKSVIRFKSVSKQWNSFISSPYFINLHMKLNSNKSLLIALESRSYKVDMKLFNLRLTCDCESFIISALMNYNNDSIVEDHRRKSYLIGCCHGLICYFHSEKFIVSNPSIGKLCYILPDPYWEGTPKLFPKVTGFGYDSSTDDYKIIVLSIKLDTYTFFGYLFSLRKNKWKKLEMTLFLFYYTYRAGDAVQINDALHWLFVYKSHGSSSFTTSFSLIFDLAKEEFSVIKLPRSDDNIVGLTQIKGCLCKVHYQQSARKLRRKTPRLEVQMLEKYGEWDSWKTFYVCDLGMSLGRDYINFFELRDNNNGDYKIFILKHMMDFNNGCSFLRVYSIDSNNCLRLLSQVDIQECRTWPTHVYSLPESLVWPSYFPKAQLEDKDEI